MTDSRNHPNTGLPRGRSHLVEADESATPVLRARVESVGSCLPERVQSTRELLESCAHRPEIELLDLGCDVPFLGRVVRGFRSRLRDIVRTHQVDERQHRLQSLSRLRNFRVRHPIPRSREAGERP